MIRRVIVPLARTLCLGAALAAAHHGYRIFRNDPFAFDTAFPWFGLALLLLVCAAFNREAAIALSPSAIGQGLRGFRIDFLVLLLIVGVAVFVRTWKYGELPPTHFLCCEEAINAGVAADVFHGTRPMNYPMVRFATAAGFWVLGENTNGMRIPFLLLGLAATIPFHFLVRALVGSPAALFSTAVFAVLYSLTDLGFHLQAGVFVTICFALALVRAVKTMNPLWWLAVGLLGAGLSYEYETFKMLPLVTLVAGGLALPVVLFRWRSKRVAGQAVTGRLLRRAALPALVLLATIAVGLAPMLARQAQGEHIYLGSLNRQQEGRSATGLASFLAPRWQDQLEWVALAHLPFIERDFPRTGSIDARGLVDGVTGSMMMLGAVFGALTFWRPWRLFFLLWFVGGNLALALLVEVFGAWKAVGFLPAGVVLAGMMIDDLITALDRRYPRLAAAAPPVLIALFLVVLAGNLRILAKNAEDPGVLRAYSIADSQTYSVCAYLRSRPPDNYTYLTQWSLGGSGFPVVADDPETERRVWHNHYFVCRGLRGETVPSGDEAWPPRVTNQTVTFASIGAPEQIAAWQRSLERAMPSLGQPAWSLTAPADVFQFVAYEPSLEYLSSLQGLWATSLSDVGEIRETILDPADLRFPEASGADSWRMRGLVHVSHPTGPLALTVTGVSGFVRIDGVETSRRVGDEATLTPSKLAQGWHVIDAELHREPAAAEPARFEWRYAGGKLVVSRDVFFALRDLGGWLHTRTIVDDSGQAELVRFDFEPHIARREPTHPAFRSWPPNQKARFVDDIWTAGWRLETPGSYRFQVRTIASEVGVELNGQALQGRASQAPDGSSTTVEYEVGELAAGDHRLALRFRLLKENFVGGELTVFDQAGQEIEIQVSPQRL